MTEMTAWLLWHFALHLSSCTFRLLLFPSGQSSKRAEIEQLPSGLAPRMPGECEYLWQCSSGAVSEPLQSNSSGISVQFQSSWR